LNIPKGFVLIACVECKKEFICRGLCSGYVEDPSKSCCECLKCAYETLDIKIGSKEEKQYLKENLTCFGNLTYLEIMLVNPDEKWRQIF